MEFEYFKAISFYRRRNYEKCIQVCNAMLQAGHENNVQMFATKEFAHEEDRLKKNKENEGDIRKSSLLLPGKGRGRGRARGRSQGYESSSSLHGSITEHGRVNNNNNNLHSLDNGIPSSSKKTVIPRWMMEGIWQLKMRALTQRIFVDDLETNDDADTANEEVEFERIATAARPGTSIKTAFLPRPSTNIQLRRTANSDANGGAIGSAARTKKEITSVRGRSLPSASVSATTIRPASAMARPGTTNNRPGTTYIGSRPATSRCATTQRIRTTSAAAYTIGDPTAALYQASRINPTIYAEYSTIVKSLFQFLFYHEGDPRKAYTLCESIAEIQKQKQIIPSKGRGGISMQSDLWWWDQQRGRCSIAMKSFRRAELFLQKSLNAFNHPDTYLLLSRVYQRMEQPEKAMELITAAIDTRYPFDVTLRTEQGRLFDELSKPEDALLVYRLIVKLNPIHIEALASIAMSYFYENNPEMAMMYYRRILAMGVHTPELHCNIALCCLYGGQIDLMLPCFQRSLMLAKTPEQRADILYNLSFVGITTGDFTLARRCLRLCLTSDANNGAALNNLAVLAAHDGNLAKAKSYLLAAREVLIDSFEIENNLIFMGKHFEL